MAFTEILVDAKLWNKAIKHMRPEIAAYVHANKGKSEKKKIRNICPLKLNISLDANGNELVREGFYKRQIVRTQTFLNIGTERHQQAIELSILRAAVEANLLSAALWYAGNPIVVTKGIETGLDCTSDQADDKKAGFVYFIRNSDIYKIGITENLLRRMSELQPDEILNVVRCKNFQEIERSLHLNLKNVRIPQTEYFRLDKVMIEFVHREFAMKAEN